MGLPEPINLDELIPRCAPYKVFCFCVPGNAEGSLPGHTPFTWLFIRNVTTRPKVYVFFLVEGEPGEVRFPLFSALA